MPAAVGSRDPTRPTAQPMIGMARTAPPAMASSASPRIAGLIARRSCTSGMCTAQRPGPAPRMRKAAETAARARTARESDVRSLLSTGIPPPCPTYLQNRPPGVGEGRAERKWLPTAGAKDDEGAAGTARYDAYLAAMNAGNCLSTSCQKPK